MAWGPRGTWRTSSSKRTPEQGMYGLGERGSTNMGGGARVSFLKVVPVEASVSFCAKRAT